MKSSAYNAKQLAIYSLRDSLWAGEKYRPTNSPKNMRNASRIGFSNTDRAFKEGADHSK